MKLKKVTTIFLQLLVLTVVLVKYVFAEEVLIIGALQHTFKSLNTDSFSKNRELDNEKNEKVIQLLHVSLSEKKKEQLAQRVQDALKHTHQFASMSQENENAEMPLKLQLKMNDVPVLDQGIHGTCVTFAVTGAMDAVIKKGDYISQLCHLQLGTYLEAHGYSLSGWDGSYATTILNQIEQYGIINKQKQRSVGCGGLYHYPTFIDHDPNSFMVPEKYLSLSEPVIGKALSWSDVFQKEDSVESLNEVKKALQAGDRLVFATLLPRDDLGTAGALGRYKTWINKDTWVLTSEILKGIDNVEAAHEMIITGYDDNAVAVDPSGKKHKGLLTLRNSWGPSLGNYGEFYMSYDYFKLLSFDLTRLTPNANPQ